MIGILRPSQRQHAQHGRANDGSSQPLRYTHGVSAIEFNVA
jgi:hypothetical protein